MFSSSGIRCRELCAFCTAAKAPMRRCSRVHRTAPPRLPRAAPRQAPSSSSSWQMSQAMARAPARAPIRPLALAAATTTAAAAFSLAMMSSSCSTGSFDSVTSTMDTMLSRRHRSAKKRCSYPKSFQVSQGQNSPRSCTLRE